MLNRAIHRRGLHDTDGNMLPDWIIRAAHCGSAVDRDMCHLSVRDMIFNMCHRDIARMVREFDLEANVWFTDPYDECGRYADDMMLDWRARGSATYSSMHDVASAYVDAILACPKPDRTFDSYGDFAFTKRLGSIPKSLRSPRHPETYHMGDGHDSAPDGVGHPLIVHTASCVPPGLVPHRLGGCGAVSAPHWPHAAPAVPPAHVKQPEKEHAIYDMADVLEPEAAYVLERHDRHDMLLYGGVDAAEAFGLADAIQEMHGTPVGCMVLGSDALLRDRNGNDAKRMVSNGTVLEGGLRVAGPVTPPRPAAVTADEMAKNLDRHGFPICVRDMPGPAAYMRPEYTIAASQFTNEARWYISGMAVLLCHPEMNWDLMLYLARTYGFAGMLRGILEGLADNGYVFEYPLSVLRRYGARVPDGLPVELHGELREVLRVYAPAAGPAG